MKKFNFLIALLLLGFVCNNANAQTTITLQPGPDDGEDASFSSIEAVNQGNWESLTVYTWDFDENTALKRALLKFDLSSIPEDAIITNAKLSLFYNPTDPYENFDVHIGENDIFIQRLTSEWDEHNVNWQNQPSATTVNQVEIPPSISPTENYLDIDVTNMVIDMTDSSNINYGFMIRMVDEINYYKSVLFASSDHIDVSLRPKLEISYLYDSTDCITLKPNADEGKDAQVWGLYPDGNYGNSHEFTIMAWTHNGIPALRRCYIDFDFSQIPSDAIIMGAELTLFNDSTSGATWGEHSQLSGSNQMYVNRINDPWNEQEITWNNYPGFSTQNQVYVPRNSSPHQNYKIDVTPLVEDMFEDTANSFGFRLQLKTEEYYRSVIFASSDHIDSTLHPELKICYAIVTQTPEDNETEFSLKLFPNPANRNVTVEVDFTEDVSLQFINAQGQIIRNMSNIQQKETLDISSFPKGIYFVRLFNKNRGATKKLIVN